MFFIINMVFWGQAAERWFGNCTILPGIAVSHFGKRELHGRFVSRLYLRGRILCLIFYTSLGAGQRLRSLIGALPAEFFNGLVLTFSNQFESGNL